MNQKSLIICRVRAMFFLGFLIIGAHATCFASFNNKKPAATWMLELPGTTLLRDINLPGTHDSAAIIKDNSWNIVKSFWARQYKSITEQLNGGVRLLDVRLEVKKNDSGQFDFVTCHGKIEFGYDPINEFQSFDSLLEECSNFLQEHSTETIVVLLKIDDWNGYDNTDRDNALVALKSKLDNSGIIYPGLDMPTLADVRGKIYLLNRIDSDSKLVPGVNIAWLENTSGNRSLTLSAGEFYVQDHYNNSGSDPGLEKFQYFKNAINEAPAGSTLINYASGITSNFTGIPNTLSINEDVIKFLGNEKKTRLGWIFLDNVFCDVKTANYGLVTCVDLIIDSNFNYGYYSQQIECSTCCNNYSN